MSREVVKCNLNDTHKFGPNNLHQNRRMIIFSPILHPQLIAICNFFSRHKKIGLFYFV